MKRYKKRDNTRLNQILMSSFLAFLMVFSILGYVVNNNSGANSNNNYEFNGFKFVLNDNSLTLDGTNYVFYTYPEDAIIIPDQAISDLLVANQPGPMITFNSDIGHDIQIIDSIRFELDEIFLDKGIFLSHGVYGIPSSAYANFPIIDCYNATVGSPVIKFVDASNTSVSYENNCLLLEGSDFGLIQLRDSLLYSLLGVI